MQQQSSSAELGGCRPLVGPLPGRDPDPVGEEEVGKEGRAVTEAAKAGWQASRETKVAEGLAVGVVGEEV